MSRLRMLDKWMHRPTWSKTDYALLCRELRMLLRAGMTVVEALEVLAISGAMQAGQPNALAKLLHEKLCEGLALSDAVHALPDVPLVLPAAIRAGERTSNLVQALDEYLRFDDLVTHLRSKVISACIYPAIVSGLGLAISVFLLLVVLPSFSRMYLSIRGPVSGVAALMMGLSQFSVDYRTEILLTFFGVLAAVIYSVLSGEAVLWMRNAASSYPRLAARIRDFHLAMTYQALSLLLRGGYPMTTTLSVAAQSATSPDIAHALSQTLHGIETGRSTSVCLKEQDLCDEIGRRLLASAEQNGQFDQACDAVAHIYRDRFESFVDRVARVIEPVLLLLVALVVGTLVVMMYLPIVEISTQMR